MLFRCTRQHIRSFLQLAGCLTPVFGTFEFRLHSKPIFLCLIAFRVLNINHISIAVVAFFYAGVDQPNRMSTEETLLQPCTLYSQLLLTYSQKCCFFSLPHSSFVNIFSALLSHISMFSLSFSLPRTILICHCTSNSGSSKIGLWTIMSSASLYSYEGNEIFYSG